MQPEVSRRDFLDGALLASGAALLSGLSPDHLTAQVQGWAGYTGEGGDYQGTAGFGLGPYAWSGFLECEWSRTVPTTDDSMETGIQMFPGGNSGLNRLMVKTLILEAIEGHRGMETAWQNHIDFLALDHPSQQVRIRLQSTVVRVEHQGDPAKAEFVWVIYTQGGKLYRLKARTVVWREAVG
jgi:hypothetical protein